MIGAFGSPAPGPSVATLPTRGLAPPARRRVAAAVQPLVHRGAARENATVELVRSALVAWRASAAAAWLLAHTNDVRTSRHRRGRWCVRCLRKLQVAKVTRKGALRARGADAMQRHQRAASGHRADFDKSCRTQRPRLRPRPASSSSGIPGDRPCRQKRFHCQCRRFGVYALLENLHIQFTVVTYTSHKCRRLTLKEALTQVHPLRGAEVCASRTTFRFILRSIYLEHCHDF